MRVRTGLALAVVVGLTGLAAAHDGPHAPRGPLGAIDPERRYRFDIVAAGGGHFHALLVTSGRLLAGTHLGLFESEDQGLTWRLVDRRLSGVDVHGLDRHPPTGRLLAATHDGLFVSHDGGHEWREGSGGLPGRDLHALAIGGRLADLHVWEVRHGLLRQKASKGRWERLAGVDALPQVGSLVVHPVDAQRLYAGTERGVWISRDGGRRWTHPVGGLYLQVAGIAAVPGSRVRLLAATVDGVFEGTDDAEEWRRLPPTPSFWGPLVAFASVIGRPGFLLAISHEGVVARDASGSWIPLPLASGAAAGAERRLP